MAKIAVPVADDLPHQADLVIIGGGIIGCAGAFYASRAGLSTVVLERREALGSLTTAASEECFRAQFDEPENVQMMLESIDVFEHFAEVTGLDGWDIHLRQQGYLFMTSGDAQAIQARVEKQRSSGLADVEFLHGDEVRYRFPTTGPEVTAASWRAKDGWLSAHELTYGFAKASEATFALRTEARSITVDSDGVSAVVTNRGTVATRKVMISAGPFAPVVAGWLGIYLPLVNLRRQKAVIGRVPQVPRNAPMTIDNDTGVYWRPEVEGAALGWALPEEPTPPVENVPTDWTFPAVVLEGAARLTPFWNDVAAALTRDNVFLSAGQYTCAPDNKPIIGPSTCIEGLYFNLGYAGHGIMASPGGSRLAIDLLLHPDKNEQNPFRLERFGRETKELCREAMVI